MMSQLPLPLPLSMTVSLMIFLFSLPGIAWSEGTNYINTSCPGDMNKAIVVSQGAETLSGLSRIKNMGTCLIYLIPFNSYGYPAGHSLKLYPGEEVPQFTPTSEASKILFACSRSCQGTGLLRFDRP